MSPCFRCSHLVAQSLAAALVSVLATPGPVLTWNNQSLPSLLPRALLLLGAPRQSPPLRNVSWAWAHTHLLTYGLAATPSKAITVASSLTFHVPCSFPVLTSLGKKQKKIKRSKRTEKPHNTMKSQAFFSTTVQC